MGQVQSEVRGVDQTNEASKSSSTEDAPQPSSMEALVAEATAFNADENESLEVRAQKALDCPCVAELRNGPCGTQFTQAFLCFLKSTAEEKGSDCVHPFISLQNCIKSNPDAFSNYDLDEEEGKEENEESKDYKIIPPTWSKEPKPKL